MLRSGWTRGKSQLLLCTFAVLVGATAGHLQAKGSQEPGREAAQPPQAPLPIIAYGAPAGPDARLPLALKQALRSTPAAYGGGRIIEGSTPHRLIYFTFDDGPSRRTTPILLNRLDAAGVKATFFLTAGRLRGENNLERDQIEVAQEIVARGHSIGNHTVDHLQLPMLTDAQVIAQIEGAERLFELALGFHPLLVRPPGGAHTPRIDELLAQRGYTMVLWNLGAGDFQVKTPEEVLDQFVRVLDWREREQGDRGGVVLLHDTHAWSVDAFQLIWAELQARNCKLLEHGEELYDIVPDLSFFYESRGNAPATARAAPAHPPPWLLAQRQEKLRAETRQRCARAHDEAPPSGALADHGAGPSLDSRQH